MRRGLRVAAFTGAVVMAGSALVATGTAEASPQPAGHYSVTERPGPAVRNAADVQAYLRSHAAPVNPNAATTVPLFSRSITSLGKKYTYAIVGKDPYVHQANAKTNVTTAIVPLRFEFPQQHVFFDPTLPVSGCGPGTAVSQLTKSPLLTNANLAGKSQQFVDATQRLQWYQQTMKSGAINPGYSTHLVPVVKPKVTITYNGGTIQHTQCSWTATVDIGTIDNFLQKQLLPQLRAKGEIAPNQFVLFVTANVIETGACGYHFFTRYSDGSVQTYAIATYGYTPSLPPDVSVFSHEISEWMNDPFGNNAVPGYVNLAHQCQKNLETGDALADGHHFIPLKTNGFTWHPQELIFFSWFYRQVPSSGFNGWYSANGTFRQTAGPACT